MMAAGLRGKVLTVLGPIDPADLGCTLSHEHLHADFSCFYSEPITEEGRSICKSPISMENLYWLRNNPYSWKANLFLQNEDEALVKELLYLKKNGCQSLVELTTLGLDRNVGKLVEFSTATGVNIVAGTGYYTSKTHPPEMDRMSQEDVEKVMTSDLMQGADGSTDNERKILRATASVQSQLGCPVSIHPGLHARSPEEAVRVLQEAGAQVDKIVMDHLDSKSQMTMSCVENSYSFRNSCLLMNEDSALIDELLYLKENGCQSVVEQTIYGLDRNVGKLVDFSEASGVNIIAGTGYYYASTHPTEVDGMTQEEIERLLTSDILEGADGSAGRCGLIGEIGCSWPMTANERKILRATASVQSQLGCPVSIHPGADARSPEEAVRVLQEAGAQVDKIVMCHLDTSFFAQESLLEFAELGTLLEFDFFGTEVAHCQYNPEIDSMNDGQRIQMIKCLVEEGLEDRVVISHDFHGRHQMMKYGGHGLSHISLHVLPKMLARGLSQDVIDKFMKTNPQRWLTFN